MSTSFRDDHIKHPVGCLNATSPTNTKQDNSRYVSILLRMVLYRRGVRVSGTFNCVVCFELCNADIVCVGSAIESLKA